MATIYGSFIMGGIKDPIGYQYLTTYTTSATFTVTKRGWYKFHVVGRGGNGGDGGGARVHKKGYAVASGGSSGSTGAYAIHAVPLRVGDTVSITVDGNAVTAVVDGSRVRAANGVHGLRGLDIVCASSQSTSYRVADPVQAADASGVTASGGNILNHHGVAGSPSEGKYDSVIDDYSFERGGKGNFIEHALCVYHPKQQTPAGSSTSFAPNSYADAPSDAKTLGGAGGGRGGIHQTSKTGEKYFYPEAGGGAGGMGGVVIEMGYS